MNEFVKIPGCTCGASENYKAGAGHNQNCVLYADAPPHPTWAKDAPLSSKTKLPAVDPALRQALGYMNHKDECGMREWSDTGDHFKTSFGVTIEAPECRCGMIAVALRIERLYFGNAAIPHQHREELCEAVPADETTHG